MESEGGTSLRKTLSGKDSGRKVVIKEEKEEVDDSSGHPASPTRGHAKTMDLGGASSAAARARVQTGDVSSIARQRAVIGSAPVASGILNQTSTGAGTAASLGLYRGLGGIGAPYFLEKQAIVIDFGNAYTKVGLATESRPRCIFPSSELSRLWKHGDAVSTAASEQEWIEVLESMMTMVFFHYLNVNPKDRRVVLCDAPFASRQFRSALAFVLFKRFAVPSVSFVVDLVLPLYLTGLSCGIVVDMGYLFARVLPTFAGIPVLSAYRIAVAGGQHANLELRRSLKARLPAEAPQQWIEDNSAIEDLKARGCFVACDLPAGKDGERMMLQSKKSFKFLPPGTSEVVSIPAETRWQPLEVFFDGFEPDANGEGKEACGASSDSGGIPEAFAQALIQCPVDVRAAVVQNIIVCGGCAMVPGLLPRLAVEIRAELRRHTQTVAVAEKLLFTPLDFAPVCAVWTGGAVFAALEGASDYSASDYEKGKPLPDWAKDGFV